ncbi:hypothetical protein ACC719_35285, partial [Rhizobium ruizarguesonis]
LTLNAASANLANSSLTLGGLALNLSGTSYLSGARVNAITTAGGDRTACGGKVNAAGLLELQRAGGCTRGGEVEAGKESIDGDIPRREAGV